MTSISPSDLDQDFKDFERPFSIRDELFDLFDAHLRQPGAVAIADTSCRPSEVRPAAFEGLTRFVCDPLSPETAPRICARVDASHDRPRAYDLLLEVASPYSTVITLTTLPPGNAIRPSEYLGEDRIQALLNRVERILVGVVDERSMMMWTRMAPAVSDDIR